MSFQHAPEPADFIVQRARIRLMEEDDAGLQDAVDQMLVAPLATPSTPPPLR
jgi:hypothetical protein